jgi:hypothetical protein
MLGFGTIGQFAIGEVGTGAAETITPDKWFMLLSEPPRFLNGLRAPQQAAFFMEPAPSPFVATGWFMPLSEPVRSLPRSPAAMAPFFFYAPNQTTITPFAWYANLSEPVRARPALKTGENPFFFFDPIPLVSFSWFDALAEPVRKLRGLDPPRQQFFTTDTQPIPLTTGLIPWYANLSEPVRYLPALPVALKQPFAGPDRLLPNPNLTAILNALETKDTFIGSVRIFNRVASGEIGVITPINFAGQVGGSGTTASGTITGGSISVRASS